MKLGIRGHDLGMNTPEAFVQSVKDAKLDSIQLVLPKAIQYSSETPLIKNDQLVTELSRELEEKNVEVAMMGAYFNPIHSDVSKVEDAVANFKEHLKKAPLFGTLLVGTETGSYNDDEWTWHENNQSEEAFQGVVDVFSDLLPVAKEAGTFLTIEPAYHHVISTPKRLKRLIDVLGSENTQVTFDLFNLLHDGNTGDQHKLIDEMVELFADKIKIIHLKDFVLEEGKLVQVSPGQGNLDYPYLIEKVRNLPSKPQLIFEGVEGDDIETSRQFISKLVG